MDYLDQAPPVLELPPNEPENLAHFDEYDEEENVPGVQQEPNYDDLDEQELNDMVIEQGGEQLAPPPDEPDDEFITLKANHLTIPACISATTYAIEQKMMEKQVGLSSRRKLKTFASFCRTSVHMNLNVNDPCLQGVRMVPGEPQPGGGGPRGNNARVDSFWMKDTIDDTNMLYARCIVGMQQLAYAHSAISCATPQQRQPIEAVVFGMSQHRSSKVCKLHDAMRIPQDAVGWKRAVCQYSAALMPRVQAKDPPLYKQVALLGYHMADAVRLKEALHKATDEMIEDD